MKWGKEAGEHIPAVTASLRPPPAAVKALGSDAAALRARGGRPRTARGPRGGTSPRRYYPDRVPRDSLSHEPAFTVRSTPVSSLRITSQNGPDVKRRGAEEARSPAGDAF